MQEAYRTPRSKCSLFCSYLLTEGRGYPIQSLTVRRGYPFPSARWGTPIGKDRVSLIGKDSPRQPDGVPPRNVNRQTLVKTVPSPFLWNAGGKKKITEEFIILIHPFVTLRSNKNKEFYSYCLLINVSLDWCQHVIIITNLVIIIL